MNFIQKFLNKVFGVAKVKPPNPALLFRRRSSIIGKTGKTLTNLANTGLIEIDGQEFEAESKSGYIKINMPVKIVGKHMSWFVVEPV